MNFTEHHIILLFFRLLLTLVAVINGYKIAKSSQSLTWISFLPIIVAYSLYSGLRWGRGIDYNLYYYTVYLGALKGEIDFGHDTLWSIYLWIFTSLKLSWQVIVFSISIVHIVAGCYFLRRFKPYLAWLLPAFVLGTTLAENLMRWYFAFSFVLMGLYWLWEGNKKRYIVFCCIGFFIHYGIIINAVLFYCIYLLWNKKAINPFLSFGIYLVLFVAFDSQWMTFLIPLVQNIDLGTRYLSYQENAEFWMTGGRAEMAGKDWGNLVMAMFTIFGGHYIIKSYFKDKAYVIMYNMVIIGLFIQPVGKQVELVFRIQELFNMFNKFFYALIFYAYIHSKKTNVVIMKPVMILTGIYVFYHYAIAYSLGLEEYQTYFIWDSNGMGALPYC